MFCHTSKITYVRECRSENYQKCDFLFPSSHLHKTQKWLVVLAHPCTDLIIIPSEIDSKNLYTTRTVMALRLVLAVAGAALIAATSSGTEDSRPEDLQDERSLSQTKFCRCQADFENFYRRRLRVGDTDRQLYDVKIDSDGYYIVDGIKVLDCKVAPSSLAGASVSATNTEESNPKKDNIFSILSNFREVYDEESRNDNDRRLEDVDVDGIGEEGWSDETMDQENYEDAWGDEPMDHEDEEDDWNNDAMNQQDEKHARPGLRRELGMGKRGGGYYGGGYYRGGVRPPAETYDFLYFISHLQH